MIVKLQTEHHLEFLSLKGGCAGSSESTLVQMPYCWKSHVTAQMSKKKFPIPHVHVYIFRGARDERCMVDGDKNRDTISHESHGLSCCNRLQ